MKLLLLAEGRLAEIPLRASHVPFQITVADGGEDGRVEWSDGAGWTPFFPRRFASFTDGKPDVPDEAEAFTRGRLHPHLMQYAVRGGWRR
jgi:hypothetical protein